MKTKIVYGLLIISTMLFVLATLSFAETTASVAVTFTIPVMPGLNAPLIEENTPIAITSAASQLNQTQQEQSGIQNTATLAKETTEEKVENTTGGPFAVLKTIYSR